MKTSVHKHATTSCYHCGEHCDNSIHVEEKTFCCDGCKMVYEILNENELCKYYDITQAPGINARGKFVSEKFAYLDDEKVKKQLISFTNNIQSRVTFTLPQMHCSSCIWLLENLHKLNPAVIESQVNFPRKEINILYSETESSLRKIVELLAFIGYEPRISLNDIDSKKSNKTNRSHIFKIGIAGFCFGNIMMLSLPEYFSGGEQIDYQLKNLFSYIILFLSLPVFSYSASEFFISAYKGFQQKFINIDAPIALAVLITFTRSLYEIISGSGAGYMDSMSGIVFFMLIGRYFQNRTYDTLSFDRDYKSYFPVSVTVIKDGSHNSIPVSNIKVGDRLLIRNNELIPADALLFKGDANIDYSFVTGESAAVPKVLGEMIFAGGKQIGSSIELEVIKDVSQSYLTQLWNSDTFKKEENNNDSILHIISKYFSIVLFALAFGGFLFFANSDMPRALNALTTVLIVACPCTLLLSATFTNGNILRIYGKNKFYLKNANVIEKLQNIDSIVFDKTGTITINNESVVKYDGLPLSEEQMAIVKSLTSHSNHPLSKSILNYLPSLSTYATNHFSEHSGQGIEGIVLNNYIKLGSGEFVLEETKSSNLSSTVHLKINDIYYGKFSIHNQYRKGLKSLVHSLQNKFTLSVLSGDNDAERSQLKNIFNNSTAMYFQQSPADKLNYIKTLQKNNKTVAMIGDGLNDAGALKQSDVGISISDDLNNFSPACDAILDGTQFNKLKTFIDFSKTSQRIIYASFFISLLYNVIGLSYAVSGQLSPVIAAILMPLSSISIVVFTTGASTVAAKLKGL